jgi:uncharacterized membrane protein YcaP (DUF421 family)
MAAIDWSKLVEIQVPLLELIVRGTAVYLFLYIILRVVAKRQIGTTGASDLLMLVLIADAAQNAMSANYHSIPEGFVLCATIIFWNYTIDWLEYHVPMLRRWIEPPPVPFIIDGVLQHKAMRRELITVGELMSQLREQGIKDVREVKLAFEEPDGRISVIKADDPGDSHANPKTHKSGVT